MSEPNNEHSSLNGQMRGSRKRVGRPSDSTPPGLGSGSGSSSTTGVPCGACKFLRRRCVDGCIFAPHFGPEQGTTLFAAVHKIFGASNVSKLLVQLPPHLRCHAVQTLLYEAQARLADPVCGCVSVVVNLLKQIASLQIKLAVVHGLMGDQFPAANTPQGPPQQPEQSNNTELPPGHHLDFQPVYSNGSSASNNMINMDMFDSNLHNAANNPQYPVYSQPIYEPLQFAGPYFKNEDEDVEVAGGSFVFPGRMF